MRRWLIELLGGITRDDLNRQLSEKNRQYVDLEQWIRDTEIETLRSGNQPARFLDERSQWGKSNMKLWNDYLKSVVFRHTPLSQFAMKIAQE